jgi:magnesium-transporting ATPase (P-type)
MPLTIFAMILAVAGVELANERRAKHAVAALSRLSALEATVLRDGEPHVIAAAELVPGDVVLLDPGHRVPADLRLVAATALRVDESSLTRESVPVAKGVDAVLAPDTPLGDRVNLAFSGTLVTAGQGRGIVVATGPHTEAARITRLTAGTQSPRTPLQQHLGQLARWLLGVARFQRARATAERRARRTSVARGIARKQCQAIGCWLSTAAIFRQPSILRNLICQAEEQDYRRVFARQRARGAQRAVLMLSPGDP